MRLYAGRATATRDFYVLDDRQYRTHQVCPRPGRGGSAVVADRTARLDPHLTLLGSPGAMAKESL